MSRRSAFFVAATNAHELVARLSLA